MNQAVGEIVNRCCESNSNFNSLVEGLTQRVAVDSE
jgi:hypothetical protein